MTESKTSRNLPCESDDDSSSGPSFPIEEGREVGKRATVLKIPGGLKLPGRLKSSGHGPNNGRRARDGGESVVPECWPANKRPRSSDVPPPLSEVKKGVEDGKLAYMLWVFSRNWIGLNDIIDISTGDTTLTVLAKQASPGQSHFDLATKTICSDYAGYSGPRIDVNRSNACRETPLFLAARSGNVWLVELLVKYGARGDLVDVNGTTPFFIAAARGHYEVTLCMYKLVVRARKCEFDFRKGNQSYSLSYDWAAAVIKAGDRYVPRKFEISQESEERNLQDIRKCADFLTAIERKEAEEAQFRADCARDRNDAEEQFAKSKAELKRDTKRAFEDALCKLKKKIDSQHDKAMDRLIKDKQDKDKELIEKASYEMHRIRESPIMHMEMSKGGRGHPALARGQRR